MTSTGIRNTSAFPMKRTCSLVTTATSVMSIIDRCEGASTYAARLRQSLLPPNACAEHDGRALGDDPPDDAVEEHGAVLLPGAETLGDLGRDVRHGARRRVDHERVVSRPQR